MSIFQAAESRGVLRRLQQELRPLHRRRHRQVARGRQEGRGRPVRAGPVPDPGTVRSVQRSQVRISSFDTKPIPKYVAIRGVMIPFFSGI